MFKCSLPCHMWEVSIATHICPSRMTSNNPLRSSAAPHLGWSLDCSCIWRSVLAHQRVCLVVGCLALVRHSVPASDVLDGEGNSPWHPHSRIVAWIRLGTETQCDHFLGVTSLSLGKTRCKQRKQDAKPSLSPKHPRLPRLTYIDSLSCRVFLVLDDSDTTCLQCFRGADPCSKIPLWQVVM